MAANMLRICHFQPKCLLKIPHQFCLPTRDSVHSAKHPKTGISANDQQAGLLPQPCGAHWRLSRPQLCRSKRPLPLGVAHAHQDRWTHSQPRPICVCVCVCVYTYIYIYIYIRVIYACIKYLVYIIIYVMFIQYLYHLITKTWPKVYKQ